MMLDFLALIKRTMCPNLLKQYTINFMNNKTILLISLRVKIFDKGTVYNVMISKILTVSSETTQHSPNSSNSSQCTTCVSYQVTNTPIQGKMLIYFITIIILSLHKAFTVDVMPELKKNVLNFIYGANFKYEGMLTHSVNRFYVVAKYEIPKMEHLQSTTFTFVLMCNHLNISKSPLLRYVKHCRRIAPYVKFYKQQIDYYN